MKAIVKNKSSGGLKKKLERLKRLESGDDV